MSSSGLKTYIVRPGQTSEGRRSYLSADPRWQTAERIVASKGFARSRFLTGFLLYICELSLMDRAHEITEQNVGEQVFGRPVGYHPGEDNIVRNYARLLRQRLDEYFEHQGQNEPIRIHVPRGGYVALFIDTSRIAEEIKEEERPAAADKRTAVPAVELPLESRRADHPGPKVEPVHKSHTVLHLWTALAISLILCAGLIVMLLRERQSAPRSISGQLWSTLFVADRDTLVIPADSGLVLYQNLMQQQVSLADYANGEYRRELVSPLGVAPAIVEEVGGRRYTSIVDLQFVSKLSMLPEIVKDRFKVRYAREVGLDDLKQTNVILIGSVVANPWVELFQKDLNFTFEHKVGSSDLVIHNLHPAAGEQGSYATDQQDPAHTTYGMIAVVPNLDGTGHVLLVEGINMAGTEAAADYLFSDAMAAFLSRVVDKGRILPFEIVLKTANIGANAPHPLVIAQRVQGKVQGQ